MTSKLKISAIALASLTLMGSASPILSASADSNITQSAQTVPSHSQQFNDLYQQLDESDKEEFNQIINSLNLSEEEQIDLLQQRIENDVPSFRWKTAIIKAAARILAAKLGEKSVADWTDFLFDWEDNFEGGIRYALIHYGNFNSTAAYWTARSIVFAVA
ncbi:hypothetical protein [Fructobacillus fructosus]|uniref:Uncharacterized protein n=1 Tax=Fructobacillus fructosus TaxID=1631 RepID=A0ABN9YZ91_9LACO|nr:hypothetical protein R53140_OCIKHKEL_01373 [Fructobacillus fructosus]CAK1251211.1 hypothetical protein LMG30235_GOPAMIKF_01423 [Fructobacillus fructosus]CAK1252650.1 hypothetical protein R54866_LGPIEIPA_01502 [Fructobacillus fructosus]CAK1252729.1 hypothetical protein LMG30234_GAICNKDF_01505 [Fructobacillus fructosus]CAK1254115.1 hypothetical protein R54839_PPFHFPJH_01607 [Fructobacillus fructosus]